jgi:hypothetical protein
MKRKNRNSIKVEKVNIIDLCACVKQRLPKVKMNFTKKGEIVIYVKDGVFKTRDIDNLQFILSGLLSGANEILP